MQRLLQKKTSQDTDREVQDLAVLNIAADPPRASLPLKMFQHFLSGILKFTISYVTGFAKTGQIAGVYVIVAIARFRRQSNFCRFSV